MSAGRAGLSPLAPRGSQAAQPPVPAAAQKAGSPFVTSSTIACGPACKGGPPPSKGVPFKVASCSRHEHVVYFVDEDDADQALQQYADRSAIKLSGVWRDLDAEEMLRELDRLHGS
jgi:hypothetical protein